MNRKKNGRIIAMILCVLVIAALAWVAVILDVFVAVHPYVPDQVYSPDGSKVIIPAVSYNKDISDTYLFVHLKIQDTRSGEILFQQQTSASDRMRWSVSWVDDETIMLDSSDIGEYCWRADLDAWNETICP
jgi:hypothetical protein